MADNKDLKDKNVDAENTEESTDTTSESVETETATSETEETASQTEASVQADSTDEAQVDADASAQDEEQSGDTSQEGILSAEKASREGFSSGQATVEDFVAPDDKIESDMKADESSNAQPPEGEIDGMAAFFDRPDELMQAAAFARLAKYTKYDAFSPFPIHGMDHAMGLGPSWIPWVTFGAGTGGFILANLLQFGTMTFDWPMIVGGKSFAPWPAFIPIMFELTVLLAGVTTVIVMLIAAGCFRKPRIIDPDITNDRFVLWISAEDETFDFEQVKAFMESLDPVEVRTITKGA